MQIANPIYDSVFKYLLEDQKIAKLLISSIIGETIEALDIRAQEHTAKTPQSYTVYRLDFSATIRTPEGAKKHILIEIQKAKFSTDIMRFRKYLGGEYGDEGNTVKVKKGKRYFKQGIPIVTIYFLGYRLDHIEAPVIKVARQYLNLVTGQEILEKEDFIEELTHDSFIIQIPFLKKKRQTQLLMLLSIFDQSQQVKGPRILEIQESDFPKKYHAVIRRLQKAVLEPKVQETMELEDEIMEAFELNERSHLDELVEKDRTIEEQAHTIEEKDKAIEQQTQEKEEEKRLKEEAQQREHQLLELLKKHGIDPGTDG